MPIVYVCKNCGHILFVFKRNKNDSFGPRTPADIKNMYGGKCPVCGHELGVPEPSDIEFKPRARWARK